MQKKSKKASILIWATFLSLIIAVTFISISTKINKNLRNNSSISKQININNQVDSIIKNGQKDGVFTDQDLDNGDSIIFDDPSTHTVSLKKEELYNVKINENSDLTIKILEGGPIKTPSGLMTSSGTIAVTIGDFEIENFGGYSKIELSSNSNKNYLGKYTNYKILKKIGNKTIISSKGRIKNF